MSLLALRDGFPARAAATFGAFTDLGAYLKADPRVSKMGPMVWPRYEQDMEEIHQSRSATRWPEAIHAPLLIMHGGADKAVDPMQSWTFARQLESLGREYRLLVYGGDNHILFEHRLERDEAVISWFRQHMATTAN